MNTTSTDIASRALAALAAYGFDAAALDVERLGSLVRLTLTDGPALGARMLAASVALEGAGLAVHVHAAQRVLVACSRVLVGEPPPSRATVPPPCRGCETGRCVLHAPLFAELAF